MIKNLTLLVLLTSTTAFAREYEATYDLTWSQGISLQAEAKETLRKVGDRYEMILDAQASIGFANETTNLLFDSEQGWKPLNYSYTQSFLGRKTRHNFHFDWNKNILVWLNKSEEQKTQIEMGTLDPLGLRLQLAYLLQRSKPLPKSITLLDGETAKVRSVITGELQTLMTPLGAIEAQHFIFKEDDFDPNRSFEFWLAPSLNYQLVKLEKKDNKRFFALTIKTYQTKVTP